MHNITMNIKFAKTKPDAKIPYKRNEDAGYDIYACFDDDYMVIPKGCVILIPTGLASAFSEDYYIQLEERGSSGTKSMVQHCGVIDSGFRNEWFVPIGNYTDKDIIISKVDNPSLKKIFNEQSKSLCGVVIYPYEKAICQAIVHHVPKLTVQEVSYEQLLTIKSERGIGQIGSSGK